MNEDEFKRLMLGEWTDDSDKIFDYYADQVSRDPMNAITRTAVKFKMHHKQIADMIRDKLSEREAKK